jgi:hypothetical protein
MSWRRKLWVFLIIAAPFIWSSKNFWMGRREFDVTYVNFSDKDIRFCDIDAIDLYQCPGNLLSYGFAMTVGHYGRYPKSAKVSWAFESGPFVNGARIIHHDTIQIDQAERKKVSGELALVIGFFADHAEAHWQESKAIWEDKRLLLHPDEPALNAKPIN